MSTRQKLTLGIAAIFMVTLTIVGVTFAYFVTQVTTGTEAVVDVKTANVGSVEYQVGNGTNDAITLTDVLPGTTMYKTFKVYNNSTDTTSSSQYNIFVTSSTVSGSAEFVHSTDPVSAEQNCYNSNAKPSNDANPTAVCFGGSVYDNITVTLYQVDLATFNSVSADGKSLTGTLVSPYMENRDDSAGVSVPYVVQNEPLDLSSLDLTQSGISIAGGETQYYVLKVDYNDAGANQNIESNAAVSIKASIK